jgi:hypothetical protein
MSTVSRAVTPCVMGFGHVSQVLAVDFLAH